MPKGQVSVSLHRTIVRNNIAGDPDHFFLGVGGGIWCIGPNAARSRAIKGSGEAELG
jgi:hypothetical protein